eukprot:m.90114 g.90114  ORF g.90114 m.90114 type:complete len:54 (+) comp15247_c0_seq2:50-211(+)
MLRVMLCVMLMFVVLVSLILLLVAMSCMQDKITPHIASHPIKQSSSNKSTIET